MEKSERELSFVEECDNYLTSRSIQTLRRLHVYCEEDLRGLSEEELRGTPGCGKLAVEEISEFAKTKFGIKLLKSMPVDHGARSVWGPMESEDMRVLRGVTGLLSRLPKERQSRVLMAAVIFLGNDPSAKESTRGI